MTTITDIQKRIAAANADGNFEETARLSQIASEIKKLDEKKDYLLAAVRDASSQPILPLAPTRNGAQTRVFSTDAPSSSRGGLTVELTTKGGTPIRVSEKTSAETLVVLMERILAHFGLPGLEKLTGLHVSRGPLVSRDPRRDYVNRRTGQLYAHHKIPGTNPSLYVLTHSDNQQKAKDIRSALRLLGLPGGSFRVSLE